MKTRADVIWSSAVVVFAAGVIVAGCAGSKTARPGAEAAAPPPSGAEGQPASVASAPASKDLSGNELWGQYCGFCHNAPSPKDYSDGQWAVAMAHMRVQARLNGEEERKIRKFLQASN
jgi:cytochrome c5